MIDDGTRHVVETYIFYYTPCMTKPSSIATAALVIAFVIFGIGLWAGYRLFAPASVQTERVNAQIILTALHDRGFLVTQTYLFDTPVSIDRSTGSAFKDFFFGQTIEARGTMEVNLGIDLSRVSTDDVTVDPNAGTVTVRIPKATLFNSRLVGPIELKNKEGILKRLLNSDDGYNDALAKLSQAAEEAANRQELLDRANERAKEDVSRLLGYVAENKKIIVEFE
jgi:hypothetical protein